MTEEREKEWRAAHEWLTTLSTRSALMVAENSGHNVNFDRPDLYLTAVQKLLEMQ
jgi:pimeloyl-ACP methyl ester carboxylesterase